MMPDRSATSVDPLHALRGRLLRRARRLVSCTGEADDLVNDALLAAHTKGRDFGDESTERWLTGVLWRRAAFVRRTAARRRSREQRFAEADHRRARPEHATGQALPPLPPSLRVVARLAQAGCTRDEIRWVLDLRPDALRQRISALGRRLRGTEPPPAPPATSPAGPARQNVLPHAQRTGFLGAHDPDGHVILVRCSRNGGDRQP
ncbi:MAG: hypothetical protein KTR31_01390 [Myxococcales bacterium]|nr:hypothetical protein [Myxococcales bacterium]